MKSYAELRDLAQSTTHQVTTENPGVSHFLIMWNTGERTTQVAIAGQIEKKRDIVRMLREVADKLEKDKGKQVIIPV